MFFGMFHLHKIWGLVDRIAYAVFWMNVMEQKGWFYFGLMSVLATFWWNGTLGHSYGGNTVLFLSALDERIAFSCASGSACTFENRMLNNVGIEIASVIPNFHGKYDIYDLVSCIAPRHLLIVSGDDDKYSKDASYIIEKASPTYLELNALHNLQHKRYQGGHALTKERFDYIIEWLVVNSWIWIEGTDLWNIVEHRHWKLLEVDDRC